MSTSVVPVSDTAASPMTDRRRAATGLLFAGIWLFYLAYPLSSAWQLRDSVRGWVAMVLIVSFAVVYLVVFARLRAMRWQSAGEARPRRGWVLLLVLFAQVVLTIVMLGQPGTAMFVYVATVSMQVLPMVPGFLVVASLCAASELGGRLIAGWEPDSGLTIAIAAAGVAMWGVGGLFERNRQLLLAREENARLAVAEERDRFARDLHDILGHSLTVISMKAELAQKLLDVDAERARSEIADLERLSRDALADVRLAVSGHREASLPGEIARARRR